MPRARWSVRPAAAALVLAVGFAVLPVATPAADAAAGCGPSPFSQGFTDALARRWPGHRFSVAVTDTRTGCQYAYRPELRMTTASVIKAEIMAAVLLRAQGQGRGLTSWEASRVRPMITQSDNATATALWQYVGGIAGMQATDRAFGLTSTVHSSTWGLTSTSAADRTSLMRQLVVGPGPLGPSYRAIARSYLEAVVPSQDWGATAGAPGGYAVPLKNGFADSPCCAWRINTSGAVVRPDGTAAVLTVLSDGWPSQAAGIPAVAFVSEVVNRSIAERFGAFGGPAAFVDRQYRDLFGRTPSFDESLAATRAIGWTSANGATFLANQFGSPTWDRTGAAVLRLYLGALHRLPDGGSFAHRMWQLRTGRITLRGLAQLIATSAEFDPAPLMTATPFVERVVNQVLGQPANPGTRADWAAKLNAGTVTRGDVLFHYTETNSARFAWVRHVQAGSVYLALLGRAPSTAVLDSWVARFGSGTPFTTMVDTCLRSPEYAARVR